MGKTNSNYIVAWKKENTYRVMLQFNKDKDKEIIKVLQSCKNKNDFIRELLNDYLKGK